MNPLLSLTQSSRPAVIRREAPLRAPQLTNPPVLVRGRLLDDADAVALAEREVSFPLAVERIQRNNELVGLAGGEAALRRGRRWGLLLGCCCVCTTVAEAGVRHVG